MFRKFIWLCLAFLATSPARADISSWADLRERVDGRGEQIVRRLALHKNDYLSELRLPDNATNNFYARIGIREIGGPSATGGQLYEVVLRSDLAFPDSDNLYAQYGYQNNDIEGRILFWPYRYAADIVPEDLLKFYVYSPNGALNDPARNLQIVYAARRAREHQTNNNGGLGGLIYPGCYTFKAGSGIRAVDPAHTGTCPLSGYPAPGPDLAEWTPQDALVGPGWLHASLREGQNEFEGLILVIQPDDARLDLSTAADCDADAQACRIAQQLNEVPEASAPVATPPAAAESGIYLALVVAPTGAGTGAGAPLFSGISAGARLSFSSPESGIAAPGHFREIGAAGATDLSLFTLTLSPEMAAGFAAGAGQFTLPLEWPTAGGLCRGEVVFSNDFTALPAPHQLACAPLSGSIMTTETLPSLPETVQNTLVLRSRLAGISGAASPFTVSSGPCHSPPEFMEDAETSVFCVNGPVLDAVVSFTYQASRLDSPDPMLAPVVATPRHGDLLANEAGPDIFQLQGVPEWAFAEKDILRFDLAFPDITLTQAFVDTLDIRITRVSDGEVELAGIVPALVSGENVVRITLPKHVDEAALLRPDEPVYQVQIDSPEGALLPLPASQDPPSAYFPEDSASLFYLDLNDFLSVKPLVVSFGLEAQTFAWANQPIRVRASLPGTQNAPYMCALALRVADQDYALMADSDRTVFTFPYDFPELAADDMLGIVARPRDYISDPREAELAALLCPDTPTLVSEALAADIDNSGTVSVPLGQPVLSYILRSGTSEDKYGTRNEQDIYRVGFAPVLALEETRIVGRYLPQRGGGGARGFRLVSRFSASDPLVENVTPARVDAKLSEMLQVANLPDGAISVKAALRDALRAREDFGLTGGYWPDVIIQASGDRLMTCATLDRAIAELELDLGDQVSGIGSERAKLAVIYDSYSDLESGALYESARCRLEHSFGEVLLFKTSLDTLFRSGGRRFSKAAEIQAEWATALDNLLNVTVEP